MRPTPSDIPLYVGQGASEEGDGETLCGGETTTAVVTLTNTACVLCTGREGDGSAGMEGRDRSADTPTAGVLHQAVDGPAVPPPPTFDEQAALAVQLVDGQLTGSILPIYVRLQFGSCSSQLGSF